MNIFILPVTLALTALSPQEDKEQLFQNHQKIYQAIAAKKEADLQHLLKPEFVFTDAFAKLWDKSTFINGFVMHPAIGLPVFESSGENITIVDNTAILTSLAHIHIKRGDQPVQELWEKTTETWIKQRGIWTLLALQATFVQKN